jgi:hypothetical protein
MWSVHDKLLSKRKPKNLSDSVRDFDYQVLHLVYESEF